MQEASMGFLVAAGLKQDKILKAEMVAALTNFSYIQS